MESPLRLGYSSTMAKARVVSFHCIVRNRTGQVISRTYNQGVLTDSFRGPLPGSHEPYPKTPAEPPGLAHALTNLRRGEKRRIHLSAEEAYGLYDPELVIEVLRSEISEGARVQCGSEVLTRFEDKEPRVFRVIEARRDSLTLDGNHPLAGQDLIFDIEAIEVRDATSQEIADSSVTESGDWIH
ncbi:MAG: peptidylprolyl isomerase [Oligoflexia bacterium]|nr:peptidylprolyl isomerase [Oligoflexia bacterium]